MTNAFSLLDQFFCLPVGMLSKSKGQILRVSAAFHVLFDISISETEETEITDEISEEAVTAAINFVQLCCQQTAYMAGRGKILEEIQIIKASTWSPVIYLWSLLHCGIPIIGIAEDTDDMSTGEIDSNHSTPAHCLRLPGRILDLKALLKKKSSESLTATRKGLLQHFLSSRLQN